jgi:hypothetical protein
VYGQRHKVLERVAEKRLAEILNVKDQNRKARDLYLNLVKGIYITTNKEEQRIQICI